MLSIQREIAFAAATLSSLTIALFSVTTASASPIAGVIAGVHGGGGCVWSARTGRFTTLPGARHPGAITISPDGKRVIYFLPAKPDEDAGPYTGYTAASPFSTASAIHGRRGSLTTADPPRIVWIGSGRAALSAYQSQWSFDPARNRATATPAPVESASDNGWIAYSTDFQIHARNLATGDDRVLFDDRKPARLLAELTQLPAKNRVQDLTDGYDAETAKSVENWVLSTAVTSHDGRSVYFLCNFGTGEGAQGNATMGFVQADVRTGRLRLLDRLGVVFGRTPDVFDLSPDGKSLLVASSVHDSAADNSYVVLDVDIAIGKSVNLLATDAASTEQANVVEGACWSPDSCQIAVSVWYYDVDKAEEDSFNPRPNLEIKDASTGGTVAVVKDFSQPSWGR